MNKCFEIDQNGEVSHGIKVDLFVKASEGITRPSIVMGGKGVGSRYGIIPIYNPDRSKATSENQIIRYIDKNNRVYGLWLDIEPEPKLTFSDVNHQPPDKFGSSSALIAFRTHNRCRDIRAYTGDTETITCLDETCRAQLIGVSKTSQRRCRVCEGKVKSTFRPFPSIVLTDGDACDDGDMYTGLEILAEVRMGYAFRVVFTVEKGKNPYEVYYQYNGTTIQVLYKLREDKHGYKEQITRWS